MVTNIIVSDKISTSAVNNGVIPPKYAVKLMNSANLEPPPELQLKETLTYFDSNSFDQTLTKTFREIFLSESNITEESNSLKSSVHRKSSPKNLFDLSCGSRTSRSVKLVNTNLLKNDLYMSSSESDPFATDNDENDPEFVLSDHEPDEEEVSTGKSRKRKRNPITWRRNVIKASRNSGKEYKSWKDKLQPSRKIKDPCNCRMKCNEKISEKERKSIFGHYWNLGDINRQRDFISKLVQRKNKERTRIKRKNVNIAPDRNEESPSPDQHSRRTFTYNYSFIKDKIKVPVCQIFFLNTLSISSQVVKTVFNKTGSTGVVSEDRRGKACKNSLLNESVKESVREHINSFQTVESHYCRKNTSRLYLPASLNISKMYSLYQEYCSDKNITEVATESIYRAVFNSDFNMSFFRPKKDLCDICHGFKQSSAEEKLAAEETYQLHMKNKNSAREFKDAEKKRAEENRLICCAVFDLQQILPVPKSEVGLAYYKLKLSTYNFTIFNLGNKECYCYMWYETIAKRGSCEIGSCLLNFIKRNIEKGVNEFSFFSDNCTGQNRNKYLFSLYNYISQLYKVTICHSFLERGHTQNEGDSIHSVIERASRNIPVYSPDQWYTVVRTAKKNNPYNVIELEQENIFDLKDLQEKTSINWDKDEYNEKVYWNKLRILQTRPGYPNICLFKYNFEDTEFKKINLTKKGRKTIQINIEDIELKPKYTEKIPLAKKKYDHLQFLCQKKVISCQYHDFFKNLPYDEKTAAQDLDSDG